MGVDFDIVAKPGKMRRQFSDISFRTPERFAVVTAKKSDVHYIIG